MGFASSEHELPHFFADTLPVTMIVQLRQVTNLKEGLQLRKVTNLEVAMIHPGHFSLLDGFVHQGALSFCKVFKCSQSDTRAEIISKFSLRYNYLT